MLNEANLVLWSGGLDSTVALNKLLVESDLPVHVHHINLVTNEKRNKPEALAVQSILNLLNRKYSFSYTESTIEYDKINGMRLDMYPYLVMGFMVAKSLKQYNKVHVCTGWWQLYPPQESYIAGNFLAEKICRLWIVLTDRTRVSPELVHPIKGMIKQEIYEACPPEFHSLFWSCRRPVYDNGSYRECGICTPCKAINPFKI